MAPEAARDLVESCKEKLKHFRIKELKDVLHQLGLSKQGKKQDLSERILVFLLGQPDIANKMNGCTKKNPIGKEIVAEIIEDTFRKMQDAACADATSKSQTEPVHSVKPGKKSVDSSKLDVKIRCLCSSSMTRDSMIKCEDPRCNVWQHIGCVIIPEKPLEEDVAPEVPSSFYCEMCRINRADPFWVTINHPLLPMKVTSSGIAADGSYTVQCAEKNFALSKANREMLQKAEYDLQVWCILLNDKVPFRMHWPLHADLQVNGVPFRVVNRAPTQQLGDNGRDDGPIITGYCQEGPNKIVLARGDSRTFCIGVRIAKRRSVEQVLNLVPKEADGEKFEDALCRVRRCLGGGTVANNADSDSDIEVVADCVPVDLRCPVSGSRIRIAGRFKPCIHMRCFDLEAFVELNQRSRKWQCPTCMANYSLENIIIDPYFNRITALIQKCRDDVTEIELKPDGSWRIKGGGVELNELVQWHLPDGTSCMATNAEATRDMPIIKEETKQEVSDEEHRGRLKLGIRKNNNGKWEISKTECFNFPSSGNDLPGDFESKNCIMLRSNADINHGNAESHSFDLEKGHSDYPGSNVHDLDSAVNSAQVNVDKNAPTPSEEHDIIILSDSDDDNITVLSPAAVNFSSSFGTGIPLPRNLPETSGVYGEDPGLTTGRSSYLGINADSDDLELSFWDYPMGPQNGPTYELFDLGPQVAHNLDVQNCPENCQPLDGSVSGADLRAAAHDPLEHAQNGSLQALMCNKPDGGIVQDNSVDHSELCTDGHSENWISLRLGDIDESSVNADTTAKRKNSEEQLTASDTSILRSATEDGAGGRTSRSRSSYSPFSPPRHPRSVRPRLILSIDSDSE